MGNPFLKNGCLGWTFGDFTETSKKKIRDLLGRKSGIFHGICWDESMKKLDSGNQGFVNRIIGKKMGFHGI